MESVEEYIDFMLDKLNELAFEYISYSDYARMTDWLDEIRKCVNTLEKKQKPMKPDIYPNGKFYIFECGECGVTVSGVNKYCHNCGQKLDWEDEMTEREYSYRQSCREAHGGNHLKVYVQQDTGDGIVYKF